MPDAGVTVAVNVTDTPEFDGVPDDISAVLVFTFVLAFTTCATMPALPL